MKRKHLIKGLLLTLGFLCTMGLGIANAETTITHYPDSNVEYTLNKGFSTESGFTAGTITISDGETTITMLDRNLGATAAGTGCEDPSWGGACMNGTPDETYGYHFQRGNNYGFAPNFNSNDTFPNGETVTTNERVDTSTYGPSEYSGNIFRKIRSSPYDWSNPKNDNLRGGVSGTYEAMQGPCPEGYHVPSSEERLGLSTMLGYGSNSSQAANSLRNELYLPFAGYRGYSSAGVSNQGINAYYWSSTAYSADDAYYLFFRSAGLLPQRGYSRSYGFSVRCFKNSPYSASNLPVNFWTGEDMSVEPACSGQLASGEVISGDLLTCVEGLSSSKQRYSLSGRRDVEANARYNTGDVVTTGLNLVAKWTAESFSITYDLDGGTLAAGSTNPNSYTIESSDITLKNPVREGYTFAGWTGTDLSEATLSVTITAGSTGNRKYFANWTEKPRPTSGGGGSSLKKDNCPNGDYSDSYYDGICGNKDSSSQTPQNDNLQSSGADVKDIDSTEGLESNELQTAYERAYQNGITTMDTVEKADLNGNLTRIAMAKMLSQYAINVLEREPDTSKEVVFRDVSKELDSQYNDGVILSYQLGIMGINMPNNEFRPFDLVPRSEFVTALSRMKYGTPDGKEKYYSTHMELLNKLGIITVTDPEMLELRGYVMLMLMRSAN